MDSRPVVSADLTLPNEPSSVRAARIFVAGTLRGWDLSELLDAALLAVSELVTNAILHAETPCTVSLRYEESRGRDGVRHLTDVVTVEVGDGRPGRLPPLADGTALGERGRGLRMVADLAEQWGVRYHPTGKTIWFTLDPRPAERRLAAEGQCCPR